MMRLCSRPTPGVATSQADVPQAFPPFLLLQVFDDPGIASSPLAISAERCVELFSFAKSHQMGGFRLGFVLGNAEVLAALEAVKVSILINNAVGLHS
jgi:hypothetical protein